MAQSLCDSYLTCRWLLKAAVWLDTTHMSRAKHSHSNLKLTGSGNKIFSVARNHDARGRLSSSNYFLWELLEIARLRFGDSPKSDGGKINCYCESSWDFGRRQSCLFSVQTAVSDKRSTTPRTLSAGGESETTRWSFQNDVSLVVTCEVTIHVNNFRPCCCRYYTVSVYVFHIQEVNWWFV